jgi:tetratricopeptide (TPR) repeat protein
MTPGKLWWLGAGSLIVAASLIVLSWPYAASVFHLEAGGRALERALPNEDTLMWWYIGPREARDPQALQAAIAHLEQAPKTPYAQRLLGRAYFAQPDASSSGDLLKGVRALEQFTGQRPNHRLGRLELAAAYALMDQRLQEMEYVDLLTHLPGATVSAPDLERSTEYPPEGWKSEYVYPTSFGLPPNYGDRPTLFIHAGAQVTLTIEVTEPSVLSFGMGLDPRSLNWGGDGATFEVFVEDERAFLEHLSVERAREGWQERTVDLTALSGHTIHLSLATTPGPTGDVTADWAGWGEPRLEAPQAAAYRQVVSSKPWVGKWQEIGVSALDFIRTGEIARSAQQYQDALRWFRWAELLIPGRGDPWYYSGLVYEDQERWAQALDAYQHGLELGGFWYAHRSSLSYRSGLIYQLRVEPRQLDAALAAYETAFEANNFGSAWERADCHYRRGEILWWQRADLDESIAECKRAIAIYPKHVSAYILFGLGIYERDKDATAAEEEIIKALELAPQNKWAYYYLGEIYRQEEQWGKATASYRQALEIAPDFEIARQRLQALESDSFVVQ